MKATLSALLILFCLTSQAADSFEQIVNGKKYLCTEEPSTGGPTVSVSQLCRMAQNGNGSTIYHSNGKVFTYSAGQKGATWYYDDGKVITYSAGQSGSSWYYSNGKVLTHSAGQKGASWYYSNGNVITHSAGQSGATWYYPDGRVMTHSGPEMSEEELAYPCDYIE